MRNSGRGHVAGEHMIGGLTMIRHPSSDGSDHRYFVGNLSSTFQIFAEHNAGDVSFHNAEGSTIFNRCLWFRIPGFLVGHAPWKDNLNHAFRATFGADSLIPFNANAALGS